MINCLNVSVTNREIYLFYTVELLEVADLLKIDYQILLNCLIKGSNKWSHVDVCLEIDAMSALRIANSLCRILYGRLFTWIITKINEALKVSSGDYMEKLILF